MIRKSLQKKTLGLLCVGFPAIILFLLFGVSVDQRVSTIFEVHPLEKKSSFSR